MENSSRNFLRDTFTKISNTARTTVNNAATNTNAFRNSPRKDNLLLIILFGIFVFVLVYLLMLYNKPSLLNYTLSPNPTKMDASSLRSLENSGKLPSLKNGREFAYSFWVHLDSPSESDKYNLIMMRGDNDGENIQNSNLLVFLDKNSNKMVIKIKTTDADGMNTITNFSDLIENNATSTTNETTQSSPQQPPQQPPQPPSQQPPQPPSQSSSSSLPVNITTAIDTILNMNPYNESNSAVTELENYLMNTVFANDDINNFVNVISYIGITSIGDDEAINTSNNDIRSLMNITKDPNNRFTTKKLIEKLYNERKSDSILSEGELNNIRMFEMFATGQNKTFRDDNCKFATFVIDYVPLHRWINVIINVNNNLLSIIVDGAVHSTRILNQESTECQNASSNIVSVATGDVKIGAFNGDIPAAKGYISKIQFFNYSLKTSRHIQKIYESGPVKSSNVLQKLGLQLYGIRNPLYRIDEVKKD